MTGNRPGPDPKVARFIALTLILSCVIVILSGAYLLARGEYTIAGFALIGAGAFDGGLAYMFLRRTRSQSSPTPGQSTSQH